MSLQMLELSICAASFDGPNIRNPRELKTSTIPAPKGSSGPTIVDQSFSLPQMSQVSENPLPIGILGNIQRATITRRHIKFPDPRLF